jgi:hypothetical protein
MGRLFPLPAVELRNHEIKLSLLREQITTLPLPEKR